VLAFFIQNLFEPEKQLYFGCVVVTVIISIVLHELAHGWTAIWQGDDTPRQMGHITADPMVHMGGMSLLMLAVVGIAFGAMPVNPHNFRSRYGDALVSAAGPAMNFLLALMAYIGLAIWLKTAGVAPEGPMRNGQVFLTVFGFINVALGIFNLLPVPPLDGSTVLGNFVPAYRRWMDSLGNPMFLFFILFIVLMNAPFQYHPFGIAMQSGARFMMLFGSDVASGYLQLLKFIF
jgi:Zn-dependent protease